MSAAAERRHPDFRDVLNAELARRRRVNRRYSLRAFAEWLGVDHSTLSQILRGRRAVPVELLHGWAARLGLGREEAEIYAAAAAAEPPSALAERLRRDQWLGEAALIMDRPAHWRLLALLREQDWRADLRWAAERTGLGLDELHDAFARLLRLGMLRVDADGTWRDATGLDAPTEKSVREFALERARRTQPRDA